MERTYRIASSVWLFPLLRALAHAPAYGQVNLGGVWNNLQIRHEDEPERLPGPELGGVWVKAGGRCSLWCIQGGFRGQAIASLFWKFNYKARAR
jgi:hypothetical protein